MKRSAALTFLVTVCLAGAAQADAGSGPVVLVVRPDATGEVLAEALIDELSTEVGIAATLSSTGPSRGSLTVGRADATHFLVTYRAASGREISRTVATTSDRRADVETIALIAANLIRDEAEELIDELSPAAPSVHARLPDRASQRVEPLGGETKSVLRVRSTPARANTDRLALGILGYVSPSSAAGLMATGSGLFVAGRASRHLAIGMTDLALFPQGGHTVGSGGPFVEAFSFATEWLQIFGQLGVPVQVQWGHNRDAALETTVFVGSGLRFWFERHTSIAAGARLSKVAWGELAAPPAALVAGTVFVGGGLELSYHL